MGLWEITSFPNNMCVLLWIFITSSQILELKVTVLILCIYMESKISIEQNIRRLTRTKGLLHLTADHDMSDFRFAIAAVRLVISSSNWQDKIPRMALALPHQEAAILSFLCQKLLSLSAWQVSVEPPSKRHKGKISFSLARKSQNTSVLLAKINQSTLKHFCIVKY